jgi:hypothetical protein
MSRKRFFELSKEITDRYLLILEETPTNSKYLKYLTDSCLTFTSFVAYVNDEFDNDAHE